MQVLFSFPGPPKLFLNLQRDPYSSLAPPTHNSQEQHQNQNGYPRSMPQVQLPFNQDFHFGFLDTRESITGRLFLISELESFGAFSPKAAFWLGQTAMAEYEAALRIRSDPEVRRRLDR